MSFDYRTLSNTMSSLLISTLIIIYAYWTNAEALQELKNVEKITILTSFIKNVILISS